MYVRIGMGSGMLIAVGVATVALAAAPRVAEAGGCLGHLEVKAGADGKTAPNAGIVLVGYTFDEPKVTATAGGKTIATKVESWGFEDGRCGSHYYVVRPASGKWPKGATLALDLGGYGKAGAVIGTTDDTVAPTAKTFAKTAPGGAGAPDARAVKYEGVRDDASPFVQLQVAWPDHAASGSERRTITTANPGQFVYFIGSKGCDALILVDTAGNAKRFPELCK